MKILRNFLGFFETFYELLKILLNEEFLRLLENMLFKVVLRIFTKVLTSFLIKIFEDFYRNSTIHSYLSGILYFI
jgi:hypothetical protein